MSYIVTLTDAALLITVLGTMLIALAVDIAAVVAWLLQTEEDRR